MAVHSQGTAGSGNSL